MIRPSRILSVLLVALFFVADASAQKKDAPKAPIVVVDEQTGQSIVKGQLLVTLHKGVTVEDLKPIFERIEVKYTVVDQIESANSCTIATDHDRLTEIKQRLENHPFIASAVFNRVTHVVLERLFDDPIFKKPEGTKEDKDNWNLYRIKVPDAWDITTGGSLVAVIDTGAMLDHEELTERTTNPFSFATNSPAMQDGLKKIRIGPMKYRNEEVRNHGTHVSITIGGRAGNNAGIAGIAPNSRIMPLQALIYRESFPDEAAGSITGTDADITRAMSIAVDRRAPVINMSLGGVDQALLKLWRVAKTDAERDDVAVRFLTQADDHLKGLAPFLDRANRSGTIVVVAAGNDEIPAEFGSYSLSRRVISVAATTRDDKRAKFSNYGLFTTVSAPGAEIWSGVADKDKLYGFMSGTSMACPHAAGVVALMHTVNPEIGLADASAILVRTGRALDTDWLIGPLIDARAAVEEARRRRALGIREPELPPLVPTPGVNPTLPQLPDDGLAILRLPNPWNNPEIQRIIRLWLAFANARPPVGGDATLRWFFNFNGQLVNARNALITPRPVWFQFNFRWLWENAANLDSTNMGTLYEFTVGTLRGGRFEPAPGRVAEKLRPGPTDPKPKVGGTPFDPGLGKTKWSGKDGNGNKVEFEFGDKFVTIKKNGKSTRYTPKLNTYRSPMLLHLYPEDGGERIRVLLHMTDLGKFTMRTNFADEYPLDFKHDDPRNFKLDRTDLEPRVAVKPPPGPRGFQDADGKTVDPRFASVIVSDGTTFCAGDVGKYCGDNESAGPRTGIASKTISPGVPVVGHHWVVRKFQDSSGPKEYIARMKKDPRFTTESFDNGAVGYNVRTRDIGADHLVDTVDTFAKTGRKYEMSSHTNIFIYRDTFLVTYSLFEGKKGHDFKDESKRIAEETKKIIDSRFPEE